MLANAFLVFSLFMSSASAAPSLAAPTIKLDAGTFTGKTDGVTQSFLGIPFAQPPYVRLTYNGHLTCLMNRGIKVSAIFALGCLLPTRHIMGPSLHLALACRVPNRQLISQLFLAWQQKRWTTLQTRSLALSSPIQKIVSIFCFRMRVFTAEILIPLLC